ncbi:hypothetical protein LEP1GSC185_0812 [Leptospira licerasiae serovar Varillal str. VAR 010]|uniref:Nitroreductase n=2 Tax=Leptospira licerasiae TaxID=447106 RepID=A0ABN0HCL0_9LEPT|nr:hypothetical protein [Leptospira licerasiae]EIE02601.1 hypothetical protein LEP1GSC185_0812 [Leptospira licerasiae serovar Varillal str. VAR 010]EJZ43431.1 hypothetical protein LEP1GSC178_3738 [Leptospira licerasiae str. MMD4847]
MVSISRKTFIKYGMSFGAFLSTSQVLQYCKTSSKERYDYERKNPFDPEFLSENISPILKALRIGITAPNPHNVQPWKFKLIDDHSALLYVDERRLLKDTDPTFRQIHIGQGTFLENLSLGTQVFGYLAEVSLFPEGKYTIADMGKKPIAKIVLVKQEDLVRNPLSEFISDRVTRRSIYEGDDLTPDDFEKIYKDSTVLYSELKFVAKEGSENLGKRLVAAMQMETDTYNTYEESRIWFRYNDEEIGKYKDGLSLRANGVSGLKYYFARNFFLKHGAESWHSPENKKAGMDMFTSMVESSKGFIFLKTNRNEIIDWVQAGRDYLRLHLAATKNGFSLHPMSQILQEYPEMDQIRNEFESSLKPGEKIQMLVRLGRSDYHYYSPRRDTKDFII